MIDASKSLSPSDGLSEIHLEEQRDSLVKEATVLLKRLADRGHPDAQYFLADCYANGIGTVRGKQDFDKAFPLFTLAAKHGHPDAAYRAGTCCENGWGCRRESGRAVGFYKCVTRLFGSLVGGKRADQSVCWSVLFPGRLLRLCTLEPCTDLERRS